MSQNGLIEARGFDEQFDHRSRRAVHMSQNHDTKAALGRAATHHRTESMISRAVRKIVGDVKAEPTTRHPHLSAFAAATGDLARAHTLSECFAALDVSAGRVLMEQGDEAGEFMIVLEGKALVTVDGQPVAILPRGTHFGSPALASYTHVRGATVHALSDCVIGVAHRNAHATIVADFPELLVDVCETSRQLSLSEGMSMADRCIAPKPRISPMHPSVWQPPTA